MLRAIKLTKRNLKFPLDQLLGNLGAIHNGRAYTGYVFFAEDDLKTLSRNYRRSVREAFPKAKKYAIDNKVTEHFTQFETNQSLASVVKPGFVLVDFDGISSSIRKLEEFEKRAEIAKIEADERAIARMAAAASAAKEARYNHAFLPRGVMKFFVDNFGEPTRS